MITKKDLLGVIEDINSFDDFCNYLSKVESTKEKGDLFEIFCQAYLEQIHPQNFKFVERFENVKDFEILNRLNLRLTKDYGIDLIAETETGDLWTIQAKFRTSSRLNWRELSTFFGSSEKADFKLVIGNLDKIDHPLTDLDNFSSILNYSLRQMGEFEFSKLREYLGSKITPMKYEPRLHQKNAIDKAVNHFTLFDRGQMIHACGTGKTLTSLWIKEALVPKNTVIFLPSLSLLKQTLEEWFKHKSKKFSILCVCSDNSVVRDIDDVDESVVDITELGVPVTTNQNEIAEFVKGSGDKIIFSTYQSTRVLLNAVEQVNDFVFDFAIFDEAHRTTSIGDSLFGLCHFIPAKKRLFMTATPKIYVPHLKSKAKNEETLLCSMDDAEIYGEVFDEINFGEAIELGLLSDYKIKLIFITKEDIKKLVNDRYWLSVSDKLIPTDQLAKIWALIVAMREVNHVISFHSKISQAKDFITDLQNALNLIRDTDLFESDIKTYHISGADSASKRSRILSSFIKNDKSLVTNARCLTEGVDVPNIDGIYFVDPKRNLIDIVQAVGRVIRKKTDPKILYGSIILPIVVDENSDISELMNSSEFDQIWKVLQAMKGQDNRLTHVIDTLRILEGELKISSNDFLQNQYSELIDDLSDKFEINNSTLFKKINLDQFLTEISIKTIEVNGNNWDYSFGKLKRFIEENEHEPDVLSLNPDEVKIARWLSTQRHSYSIGQLQKFPDRVKKMESIGIELDLKKSRIVEEWTFDLNKKPEKFWMETGSLTGGSRNILDLSKSGPNGSMGSLSLFGVDQDKTTEVTELCFIYNDKEFFGNVIKYPSTDTKKPNDSWRLQIKGVSEDGDKLSVICKNNFRKKILLFERVAEKKYIVTPINKPISELKNLSISWDKNGLSRFGRHFGILS